MSELFHILLFLFILQERALLCQRAEHLYANAPCGIMDQFVCILAQEKTACYIDCRYSVCVYVVVA